MPRTRLFACWCCCAFSEAVAGWSQSRPSVAMAQAGIGTVAGTDADIFVARLWAAGGAEIWSRFVGGAEPDVARESKWTHEETC